MFEKCSTIEFDPKNKSSSIIIILLDQDDLSDMCTEKKNLEVGQSRFIVLYFFDYPYVLFIKSFYSEYSFAMYAYARF